MRNLRILGQSSRQVEIRGRILITPKRRGDGRNHQRDLSISKAKKRSGAAFENIRVGALRFPGKPVKGGKRGHAAGGAWKNAAKEAQCFRQRFGAAIGIRHEKSRPPQLVRQIRGGKGLGDVVEAGDGDMIRAGAQSG